MYTERSEVVLLEFLRHLLFKNFRNKITPKKNQSSAWQATKMAHPSSKRLEQGKGKKSFYTLPEKKTITNTDLLTVT